MAKQDLAKVRLSHILSRARNMTSFVALGTEKHPRRLSIKMSEEMKMTRSHRARRNYLSHVCFVMLCTTSFAGPAIAGEKPPVIPDQPSSLTTPSRISATVEFGLPAIAAAIERDIPRRLAT